MDMFIEMMRVPSYIDDLENMWSFSDLNGQGDIGLLKEYEADFMEMGFDNSIMALIQPHENIICMILDSLIINIPVPEVFDFKPDDFAYLREE